MISNISCFPVLYFSPLLALGRPGADPAWPLWPGASADPGPGPVISGLDL